MRSGHMMRVRDGSPKGGDASRLRSREPARAPPRGNAKASNRVHCGWPQTVDNPMELLVSGQESWRAMMRRIVLLATAFALTTVCCYSQSSEPLSKFVGQQSF